LPVMPPAARAIVITVYALLAIVAITVIATL
jgi:hypothetical protein